MNRAVAGPIWKETQQLIYADQPYTFLFWVDKIVAINKSIKNATPIPLSSVYGLEGWYRAKP
jgi:ABC-type transport system substrate-binding protein